MRVQRTWATPLVMGVFLLMAGTGLLMFYDLDSHFQKDVHGWLGWGMISAAALHATVNWAGLRQHLLATGKARYFLGVFALALVGTFFVPEAAEELPPQQLALRAIGRAPIKDLAPLTGRTVEQALAALQGAGLPASSAEQSLDSLTGNDREKEGDAVRLLFSPTPGGRPAKTP